MKKLFYKKMNQIMKKALLAIALIQLFAIPLIAMEEDRMVDDYLHISKLWGALKFLHPKVISREIDWNSVFIETIASMEKGEMNLSEGIDNLLNRLDDIHTFVAEDNFFSPNDSTAANTLEMKNRILYLRLNDYSTFQEEKTDSLMQKAIEYSQTANGIVLDLRHLNGNQESINKLFKKNNLIESLIIKNLELPFSEYISYHGYPNERFYASIYPTKFVKERANDFIEGKREKTEIPIVILINKSSAVPVSIIGLSLNNKAYVISVDEVVYGSGFSYMVAEKEIYMQLTWRNYQNINYKTFIHEIVNSPISDSELYDLAKNRLKTKKNLPAYQDSFSLNIKEKYQATSGYPEKEERILALAKLYAVMTYFSPHQNLMKVTPDENFKQIFPQIIAAKDSLEYNLALAQFVSNLADSHGFVLGEAYITKYFSGSFPFHLKKIDDKFIVSKIYDEKWKTEKKISVGDEILTMNDESLGSIFEKARNYFSSSNENGENYNVTNWMLNGSLDETVTLDIKNQEDTKSVLAQRIQFREVSQKESAIKDTIRFFENIAYVNLAWLTKEKIQAMFTEIKESKALIFDMRGYPKLIIWELAKFLIDEKKLNAYYQIPIFDISYFHNNQSNSLLTGKEFTIGIEKKYTNPIVVLMDESTVSQAEYTCSVIKELTGATLIGRQTAGADGDVTYVALPGNVYVSFTGMDAMNARQISEQGIGLLPDIEVEYTLEGIREERDEILEKALEYLRNKLEDGK